MHRLLKKKKKDENKRSSPERTQGTESPVQDTEMKDVSPTTATTTTTTTTAGDQLNDWTIINPSRPPTNTNGSGLPDSRLADSDEEDADDTADEEEEPVNENMGSFVFRLKSYSKLKKQAYMSEEFTIGESKWQIKVYPYGSPNAQRQGYMALYLCAIENRSSGHWHRRAEFSLCVENQNDETKSMIKTLDHLFREGSTDWGMSCFMPLDDLQQEGFLVNDTLSVRADIEVMKAPLSSWVWQNYDSKKETGCIGLKNQGATCYLNSLLQALYHIPIFRKAVYQMPTYNDLPESSIPLALQRVFYRLQFDSIAPGTKELTTSFGWNMRDSFVQHDVQELNRVFCDNLEEKMKGTISEGVVEKLFRGQLLNYIKCKSVPYESKRTESYYDISLNVKGMQNVYDSFDDYMSTETLSGENKYDAGEFGLQDAEKGCAFLSLPPILELHLKRFVYDPERDRNSKINDRYEFPQSLNLRKYLHKDAEVNVKPLYRLYGVLVHSGDVHGGHYYAFIRPTLKMQWYKFDDERVTKAKKRDVFEGNFGGEDRRSRLPQNRSWKRHSNAYMLLYIRDSEREHMLAPVLPQEIPSHLQERFEREEAEKAARKKEKEEEHLYLKLKVGRISDYQQHHGFDLVDYEHVHAFKVKRADNLKELKDEISRAFNVPSHRLRFWSCPPRRNQTVRPDEPYNARDLETPLERFLKRPSSELKIWAEESVAPDECTDDNLLFHPVAQGEAIMFFKFYDPEKQLLQFLKFMYVKESEQISSILPTLNSWIGMPPDTPLSLFEEIKTTMIEPIKPSSTFEAAELSNGDVICFQKTLPAEALEEFKLATAPQYYSYMLNRVSVKFRELATPSENKHVIELAKNMPYDDVVVALAPLLNVDPMFIRLTQHSRMTEKPRTYPVKRSEGPRLLDMLSSMTPHTPPSDILYYEILSISIQDLENNKLLKLDWYSSKVELQSTHNVLVPKGSRMSHVIEKLKELKPEIENENIRLLDVNYHKISRLVSPDEPVSGYNEYTPLRAEVIPEEQKEKGVANVQVVHFFLDPPIISYFSNPFYFAIRKNDTFSDVKKRIQEKLEIPDEEFAKWKFAVLHPYLGRCKYVEDIVKDAESPFIQYLSSGDLLGLEHAAPRRRANRRAEIGIVIKN